jgi:hypothetical protein
MGVVRWTCPLVVPLALVACQPMAERANIAQLQARAAFDLGCPYVELQLFHFDERSKGVTGCNRRLTYVEVCDPVGGVCTWMLDTPAFEQQQWPGSVVGRPPPLPAAAVPCTNRVCEQPAATAPAPSASEVPSVPRIDRGF